MEAGEQFVVLILSFLLNVVSRDWTQVVSLTSPKVAFENAILSGHGDPHIPAIRRLRVLGQPGPHRKFKVRLDY